MRCSTLPLAARRRSLTPRALVGAAVLALGLPCLASANEAEPALDAVLRQGHVPAAQAGDSPRVRAARGVVAAILGRSDEALGLLSGLEVFAGDCALRARLAELGGGAACPGRPASDWEEGGFDPPVAFAILAPQRGEKGERFPTALLSPAMKAMSPEGGLRLESTGERFRVSGSSALEGLLYLEDRLLVWARPGPGRPAAEAVAALDRFLALSPSLSSATPTRAGPALQAEASTRIELDGLSVDLPPGWSRLGGSARAWLPPGAGSSGDFPPAAGALAVRRSDDALRLEPRRNPLARRKRAAEALPPELAALPPGATLVASSILRGGSGLRALEWRPARGAALRESLFRVFDLGGRELLLVAHLGSGLDQAAATDLLERARASRPDASLESGGGSPRDALR